MSLTTQPRLVGVIDLMGGVVVRGVGGRRSEYRPVLSRLCESPEPLHVANAFREQYGIEDLYVADLDAILGSTHDGRAIAELAADGFRVAVDSGLRTELDADAVLDLGAAAVIAGLETLAGPEELTNLVERIGSERLVFSLDLANAAPLADPATWGEPCWNRDSPLRIAEHAGALGVGKMVLLELRAVGERQGPVVAGLCRQVKDSLPHVTLWTGGGVRDAGDLRELSTAGADGVLVATALHDRTLEIATEPSGDSRQPAAS